MQTPYSKQDPDNATKWRHQNPRISLTLSWTNRRKEKLQQRKPSHILKRTLASSPLLLAPLAVRPPGDSPLASLPLYEWYP